MDKLYRFYDGMCRFKSFRRFYQLNILILLSGFQYIDMASSSKIANHVVEHCHSTEDAISAYRVFGPFVSNPVATALAAFFIVFLFFYKTGDWFFRSIGNKWCYVGLASCSLVVGFFFPRWFILAETLYFLLMASCYYPQSVLQDTKEVI